MMFYGKLTELRDQRLGLSQPIGHVNITADCETAMTDYLTMLMKSDEKEDWDNAFEALRNVTHQRNQIPVKEIQSWIDAALGNFSSLDQDRIYLGALRLEEAFGDRYLGQEVSSYLKKQIKRTRDFPTEKADSKPPIGSKQQRSPKLKPSKLKPPGSARGSGLPTLKLKKLPMGTSLFGSPRSPFASPFGSPRSRSPLSSQTPEPQPFVESEPGIDLKLDAVRDKQGEDATAVYIDTLIGGKPDNMMAAFI